MSRKVDITDYDKYKYDYSKYWEGRDYEHLAEKNVLKGLFSKVSGTWFIDIGGSYGRHTEQYYKKFHNCVLCDYSINSLKKAQKLHQEKRIDNVVLVAANIYNMPFKDESFDVAMMIRVLHHLQKTDLAISEISRTFCNTGHLILEYANKMHIKNILKWIFTLNIKNLFSTKPLTHKTSNSAEGTKAKGIFINYHPFHVKQLLENNGLKLITSKCTSFFRIPFIKRLVSNKILMFHEKLFQKLFSWTKLTPSVITLSQKMEKSSTDHKDHKEENSTAPEFKTLESILCCPNCKTDLDQTGGTFVCKNCKTKFPKVGKIYDFRYPRPKSNEGN